MTVTHAHQALAEAIGIAAEELDGLIDRHFAANRSIRVDGTPAGWYCATINDHLIFPPTPNLDTVIRFVRAFAAKNPGVTVDEASVEWWRAERAFGHSMRVIDALGAVTAPPDNVIQLPVRETA